MNILDLRLGCIGLVGATSGPPWALGLFPVGVIVGPCMEGLVAILRSSWQPSRQLVRTLLGLCLGFCLDSFWSLSLVFLAVLLGALHILND